MPRDSHPSRIYDDPALTDRRGDATGPVALLFLVLVVAAFAAVAYGLVTFLPVAADPTPRPTSAATSVLATAAPTPSPAPTAAPDISPVPATSGAPAASGAPDTSPEPAATGEPPATREPGATTGPLPSRVPRATPTSRPPSSGGIDEAIPVVRNGKRIGTVTMTSFAAGDVAGVELPAGARFMVMEITYATTTGMPYDAADWVAVSADGKRYPSLGGAAPDPALGKGRLAAGGTITGNVAFIRERKVAITELVLTDGDGADLVTIERPATP